MTAATVDELVSDYLSRLEAVAADLPDARRSELVGEIREHIETARSEGVAADEATTRTMLDQLGEPKEIAAAARAELDDTPAGSGPPATVEAKPGTGLELAAVLLLTIGSFIPIVGWTVGVVLLWASRRWTVTEKLVGTLIVPTGPGGVLYFGLMSTGGDDCVTWSGPDGSRGTTCDGSGGVPEWTGALIFATLLIAPLVVAGLLYSLARIRNNAEPPQHSRADALAAQPAWTGTEIAAVTFLGTGPILALMLTILLGTPIAAPVALLVGLAFVWASSQWTRHEKQVGTAIAAAPIIMAFLFLLLVEGKL